MKKYKFKIGDTVVYCRNGINGRTIITKIDSIYVTDVIEYRLTNGEFAQGKELMLYNHLTISKKEKVVTEDLASDEGVFNVGDNVLLYTGQLCTIISYDEKTNSYKLRLYDNEANIDDFYVIGTKIMKKLPNDTIKFLNSFKELKLKKR